MGGHNLLGALIKNYIEQLHEYNFLKNQMQEKHIKEVSKIEEEKREKNIDKLLTNEK